MECRNRVVDSVSDRACTHGHPAVSVFKLGLQVVVSVLFFCFFFAVKILKD